MTSPVLIRYERVLTVNDRTLKISADTRTLPRIMVSTPGGDTFELSPTQCETLSRSLKGAVAFVRGRQSEALRDTGGKA